MRKSSEAKHLVKATPAKPDYEMRFDIGTIKHLGLQMYSTLPPVIGELVSNAWDADADRVDITIPTSTLDDHSVIVVEDNGTGMNDRQVREAYLVIGRDRRKAEGDGPTGRHGRRVMGRKGIGKFSPFGIAETVEVETVQGGETSRFIMSYTALEREASARKITLPALLPTGTLNQGTRVTLRSIPRYRQRKIDIQHIRRALARRFSIIGPAHKFAVYVNEVEISPTERDLQRLLDRDADGKAYLWEYSDRPIGGRADWTVSGWIGALNRTQELEDGIQRGIAVLARGKLVQEPFVFEATVGQQYALSYLVGELHAEFVDEAEDTIGTTRNSLVWDTEANSAFKAWGQKQVNQIAREWAEKRSRDAERELEKNQVYKRFVQESKHHGNRRVHKVADKLIREAIKRDPLGDSKTQEPVVQMCLDFLAFDAFQELAEEVADADLKDIPKILQLFREWEVVEAKEMMRVTEGRITTITKLQKLIETNALEVPTLHNFLKEFPWVIDPRWTLVQDEHRFSDVLRHEFPDEAAEIEDRRIDFLCVREGDTLVVVEIKRPKVKASRKELEQIERYVSFMRDYAKRTTDPDARIVTVVGYLLVGDRVDTWEVREKASNLEKSQIYVRRYEDLLRMVQSSHREFLDRYQALTKAKAKE